MNDELFSRLQRLIRLYLPENLVHDYLNDPASLMNKQNRQLAVMFTDIRSFSSLSERRSFEEVSRDLDSYFRVMANIIYARDGIINKYIGDAILAYFGHPAYSEGTALQAVMAALEMTGATTEPESRIVSFRTAIGISLGQVSIGNVGHPDKKLDYSLIGDTVNFASRLESLTSTYRQEILVSESIFDKIREALPCRMVDFLPMKEGGTTRIYTTKKNLSPEEQLAWGRHNDGMDLFSSKDFGAALECFQAVLQHLESDTLATMMIERCQKGISGE